MAHLLEILTTKPETEVDFVVNGLHHGRGSYYKSNGVDLTHTTSKIIIWKIVKDELIEIEFTNKLLNSESYLFEWNYVTIDNQNNGECEENKAYFYWKGEEAAKGYCPLPSSCDNCEQAIERICQWSEPPVFLNLFDGKLIIYNENMEKSNERLFMLRGELASELHLIEVEYKMRNNKVESLRSRTCFVIVNQTNSIITIWYGQRATQVARRHIQTIVKNVFQTDQFNEIDEGEEMIEKNNNYTPKLFYLTDFNDELYAFPIESSHKSEEICPFPILQSHLYSAPPPAVFILDDFDTIWLWINNNEDSFEFFKRKKEIVNLAISYAENSSGKDKRDICLRETYAKMEPREFQHIFPSWTQAQDQKEHSNVIKNIIFINK